MLPLCSPPLRCWRSKHPCEDHPWSLSRLLLWVVDPVQIHYFTPVRWPTFIESPRQPGSTLWLLDNRWHGLLLPTSAQQPQAHSKLGSSSVRQGRLSSTLSGRSCQRTAEPVSHGSRQWWHPSVLCGRTGGLGMDVPSWPLQARDAVLEYNQDCVNVIVGRWWKGLPGTHLSPWPQVQQEALCVLLSGGGFWWENQDQWVPCFSRRHEFGGSQLRAVRMTSSAN